MSLFHTHTTRLVPYARTVIEKRAPTDESVRILAEMEAAARERVLASFRFDDNSLHGSVVLMRDPNEMDVQIHVRFTLNGNSYATTRRLDGALEQFSKASAAEELWRQVGGAVTEQLMRTAKDERR